MSDPTLAPRRLGKERVRRMLETGDLRGIVGRVSEVGAPRVLREVTRALFDRDEVVRWRAAVATGRLAAAIATSDLEAVRELLRRVMWWMNDESGALLWNGPQVMAEVLVQVPALRTEFGALLPRYLGESPFERGAAWALWRLGSVDPDVVGDAEDRLRALLADPDPALRGTAALALRPLAGEGAAAALEGLRDDGTELVVFDPIQLTLVTLTVAQAAGDAAQGLGSRSA